MRVTIITADNNVIIDGKGGKSDCVELLAQGISAVQWYGSVGEVEYIGHTKPNEEIYSLGPYQSVIDAVVFPAQPVAPPPPLPPIIVKPPSPTPIEKILLDMENRLLALEGKPLMTPQEFLARWAQMDAEYQVLYDAAVEAAKKKVFDNV